MCTTRPESRILFDTSRSCAISRPDQDRLLVSISASQGDDTTDISPAVKVTSLSVSPSSAPPKLSLVITDRGDAQYDQKSSPTEDGQSSMSRRRLAMNIPTLSDQLHLPSAASVNTQTSFNSFQSHFSALSPMLATPVDQILHTPIGPPEILRSPRRQPRLGNCLALRRIGCGMDSPSSPYMSPFAGLSFPSPTEMSPIAQGDMCPLHQSTPRGPFQLPPENIPIRKPINSLPPLPRRLSYFQSSAVVKPALSISDDHRRRLVIDTRSDFTREPLASPLIIGHLPTLPSPF